MLMCFNDKVRDVRCTCSTMCTLDGHAKRQTVDGETDTISNYFEAAYASKEVARQVTALVGRVSDNSDGRESQLGHRRHGVSRPLRGSNTPRCVNTTASQDDENCAQTRDPILTQTQSHFRNCCDIDYFEQHTATWRATEEGRRRTITKMVNPLSPSPRQMPWATWADLQCLTSHSMSHSARTS